MMITSLLVLITIRTVIPSTTKVLKFPLTKQYGGRAISEDFDRIDVNNVDYVTGPSGCKNGAISSNTSFTLDVSDKKFLLNESFSIFLYGRSTPPYCFYDINSDSMQIVFLTMFDREIVVNRAERTVEMNRSDWKHVGLSLNGRTKMTKIWINGDVVFDEVISKDYDKSKAITKIKFFEFFLYPFEASCLALYDQLISDDEVKTIMEECKICQVEKDCNVKINERENCGYYGIGKRKCLKKGCCWDGCMKSGQRCFYDKTTLKNSCDNVAPWHRMKCGQDNVSKQDCEDQNCCYDDTIPKGPKCFNRPATQCEQEVKDRINCGFYGIGKRNCLRRSCCWDKTQKRGKRCFYEKGAVKNDCYNIPKGRRKKCGQSGIGMVECQKLNCCFDETVLNSIKCFVKPCNSLE